KALGLEANLLDLRLTREHLIDVAVLVGTDFDAGIKWIGPQTAVKRIREWGSLDRAPPEIRAKLSGRLDEIRAFFQNPPVTEASDVTTRPPDGAGVLRFLSDERDFSPNRVEAILDRLRASR